MVPFSSASELPLLPYEKYLIETLGCTEKEYRKFADQARRQSNQRPTEYALIPDIRNIEGVTWAMVLIPLVTGALSTAAAYLLTPKPQELDYDRRPGGTQRQLGSASGRELFTPTYGFDSAQDLAAYGNIVPIVFTLQSTQVNSQIGRAHV